MPDKQEASRQFFLVISVIALLLLALLNAVLHVGTTLPQTAEVRDSPIPARCYPSAQTRRAKYTTEPLVPTSVPGLGETDARTLESKYVRAEVDITPAVLPAPYSLRWRVGVGIPDKNPYFFPWTDPRPGWYLNWSTDQQAAFPPAQAVSEHAGSRDPHALGMEFVPMVRTPQGMLVPDPETLYQLAQHNPHRTWLIGNEPDVAWQDDATPEAYARAFFCAHTIITRADPTARIAIAGLSQITPLRLAYLDRVWTYYQREFGVEMPVDVWNMHAFVLREERESWGVRIPPGFAHVAKGELWEIGDHTDLTLVEGQVRLMRQWMHAHDQRQKPLIISEYGVLLPASYGFSPTATRDFMVGSFDLFDSLRDADLGLPEDDNRLVQRWVWFSSRYSLYPTGNLFNAYSRPTLLMRELSEYLAERSP